MQNTHRNNLNSIFLQQTSIYALLLDILLGWHKLEIGLVAFSTWLVVAWYTRSQAVARIADRTAKNSSGHMT